MEHDGGGEGMKEPGPASVFILNVYGVDCDRVT